MQLFFFFLPFYRKFWHGNVSWYGRRYKRFCTFVLAWYIHTCLIYTWLYVENEDGKYVLWYNFIVCPCHVFLVFFTWNCIMLGMKQTIWSNDKIEPHNTMLHVEVYMCRWEMNFTERFRYNCLLPVENWNKINTFAFKNVPVQCMPFYYYYYYYYY